MAELKDFIVRTRLGNTDENQNTGNSAFDTQDYVFFETYAEASNWSDIERIAYPSDYAVMNGALLWGKYAGPKKDRQPTWHWLRSAHSKRAVNLVDHDGSLFYDYVFRESAGLCPAMHLNLSSVISARSASRDFKIEPFKDESGNILYHTIEFGSYPQDKARNSSELEKLYNAHKLTPTGKTYTGYMKEDGSFEQNQEFEYGGKKYVRVISKKCDDNSEYKDKTKAPNDGTPMWAEVQPIKWKIKNWDELPKSINPNGNGTAKTIYVKSEEAICSGIPFYPGSGETEYTMWQNSPLRAIFNGYDLHEELSKGNGNKRYKAGRNYDFKGKGFLQEAFEIDQKQIKALEDIDLYAQCKKSINDLYDEVFLDPDLINVELLPNGKERLIGKLSERLKREYERNINAAGGNWADVNAQIAEIKNEFKEQVKYCFNKMEQVRSDAYEKSLKDKQKSYEQAARDKAMQEDILSL